MKRPVRANDGYVYEERALQEHERHCNYLKQPLYSPLTKEPMEQGYEPESGLEKEIQSFLGEAFATPEAPLVVSNSASMLELSSLFSALDDLKDVLTATLGSWRTPYLIAFGNESVGKSSLLQRLSLLPFFPTNNTRRTRMPIRLEIRRAPTPRPATIKIWNVQTNQYIGTERLLPFEKSEGEISAEMERILEEAGVGKQVSLDKELHIKATSATLPPMNLVDLPGIVESDPNLKKQTLKLFQRYVLNSFGWTNQQQQQEVLSQYGEGGTWYAQFAQKSHGIFLAVVQGNVSPASWTATNLTKHWQLQGRAIGVITKCDRLDIDEGEGTVLRSCLEGEGVDGFTPLEPHGYVAVANLKGGSQKSEESYLAWMSRRAELRFQIDLDMADLVSNKKATIGALVDRINVMYSRHVLDNWLPLTAKSLLEEWKGCCKELRELGLPRSSGNLQGAALLSFHGAASADLHKRLGFLVDRTNSTFWTSLAKPLKDYLTNQLTEICQRQIRVLELDEYLQKSLEQIKRNLPINQVPPADLQKALDALKKAGQDAFKLERLPETIARVRSNLRRNQASLDVAAAKARIDKFLDEVFNPMSANGICCQMSQDNANVSFSSNPAFVSACCLRELATCFKGIRTKDELQRFIIDPALAMQEQETCHPARRRIFDKMQRIAKALDKMIDMKISRSQEDLIPENVLASWWQQNLITEECKFAHGDSQTDNGFVETACNFVVAVMMHKFDLTMSN